jgi:uncharacterized protein YndB with AHSA1/START domain
MAEAANPARASDSPQVLVMTRMFDAPRERVFDAWLDPEQVSRWMGPRGVRARADRLEPKVGGRYRIVMQLDSGQTPTVGGVYREIRRPERLVFTWAWEGSHPSGTGGHETIVTLTFRDVGGKTEMTMRHEGLANAEERDSHNHGWIGSFDKLAEAFGS